MKLHSSYVSVADVDGLYFQVSFDTQAPDTDFDLSMPLQPYLLIQRQFEDDDGGVAISRRTSPTLMRGTFE